MSLILLIAGLISPNIVVTPTSVITAQISTCQWPNKCAVETPIVAQISTCQWPNKCAVDVPVQG